MQIPKDVWLHCIISELSIEEKLKLLRVCKFFYFMLKEFRQKLCFYKPIGEGYSRYKEAVKQGDYEFAIYWPHTTYYPQNTNIWVKYAIKYDNADILKYLHRWLLFDLSNVDHYILYKYDSLQCFKYVLYNHSKGWLLLQRDIHCGTKIGEFVQNLK